MHVVKTEVREDNVIVETLVDHLVTSYGIFELKRNAKVKLYSRDFENTLINYNECSILSIYNFIAFITRKNVLNRIAYVDMML